MLMEKVEMLSSPAYSAISIEPTSTSEPTHSKNQGPLASYIASVPLLSPEYGAASYVFLLNRRHDSNEGAQGHIKNSMDLGKIDIRWRGPLGQHARLQTQAITVPAPTQRDVSVTIESLPTKLVEGTAFDATVGVSNNTDSELQNIRLSFSPAMAAATGSYPNPPDGIVVEGSQSVLVHHIAPKGKATVTLRMLPLFCGQQYIQGFMITDDEDGKVYDTLRPQEVFVYRKNSEPSL